MDLKSLKNVEFSRLYVVFIEFCEAISLILETPIIPLDQAPNYLILLAFSKCRTICCVFFCPI